MGAKRIRPGGAKLLYANACVILFECRYFPAFHAAVADAGVRTVMCSYNSINGTPACAHQDLFNGIVRDQWGFDGYVVSDCDAIADIKETHNYTRTAAEAVADALAAGIDLDCGDYYLFLLDAYERGLVNASQLDTSVQRLFTERIALGMSDE